MFLVTNESTPGSRSSTRNFTSIEDSNTTSICIVLVIGVLLVGLFVAIGIVYRKKIRAAMKNEPEEQAMMSTSKGKSGLVPISGILEGY